MPDPSRAAYGNRTAVQQSVAVATTSTRLCGPNPRRCGLLLSPSSTNRYSICFGATAVVGVGYTVYPGSVPPPLNWDTHGDTLKDGCFAIFETAGETLAFTELMEG